MQRTIQTVWATLAVSVASLACVAGFAKAADRVEPPPSQAQDKQTGTDTVPLATPRPGETLNETLKRNDGVLRPPEGNAAPMAIEPPTTGQNRMPVIPPPGSPGGDQSVRPK